MLGKLSNELILNDNNSLDRTDNETTESSTETNSNHINPNTEIEDNQDTTNIENDTELDTYENLEQEDTTKDSITSTEIDSITDCDDSVENGIVLPDDEWN